VSLLPAVRFVDASDAVHPGTPVPRYLRWLPWVLGVVTMLLVKVGLITPLVAGIPMGPGRNTPIGPFAVFYIALAVVTFGAVVVLGVMLAVRRPHNSLGWLFLMAGLLSGVQIAAVGYARFSQARGDFLFVGEDGAVLLAWIGSWLGYVNLIVFVRVLLSFPEGSLLSHRWQPVMWLAAASALGGAIARALLPGPLSALPAYENPFALHGLAGGVALAFGLSQAGTAVAVALGAGSLVLRYRRARDAVRLQLKWVAVGAAVWAAAFIPSLLVQPPSDGAVQFIYMLCIDLFLASLFIAIFRYRLYQLDVIVNRTLVYGVLAAAIAGVYGVLVVGAGAAVGKHGAPDLRLSLLATTLMAIVFAPLRLHAERLANRLIYGERATPYEAMSAFTRQLEGALTGEEILPRIAEAVAHGVGATGCEVRVYLSPEHEHVVAWPPNANGHQYPPPAVFDRVVPVFHRGEQVGEIAVTLPPGGECSPAGRDLLEDFSTQAGVAMSNARMAAERRTRLVELTAQATALRASRGRIVAAQDAARRRLERDIHDGAQQHLVALSVTIRLARQLIERDPQKAAQLLDSLKAQTNEAIETLRNLARGIFPPLLRERGLAAALSAHAFKTAQDAHIQIDPRLEATRFDPALEAAVYFCCLEALQNAARHAPDAPVTLDLSLSDAGDVLRFVVADEGPGFEPGSAPQGTGLQSMRDRMEALGGQLTIVSAPGQGTRISGEALALLPAKAPVQAADQSLVEASQAASASGPKSALER
jgi:signal transduction histidine kinase